jgi:hypothetical protein
MVIRAEDVADAPAEPTCEAGGDGSASCGYGGGGSYRYTYVSLESGAGDKHDLLTNGEIT